MLTDRPVLAWLAARKYAILFAAMVGLILAGHLVKEDVLGGIVHALLLTAVGVAAVLAMIDLHRGVRLISILMLLAVLGTWGRIGTDQLIVPGGFARATFEFGLGLYILKDVLFDETKVHSERLFGAAVVYLIVAAGFAEAYLLITHFDPDSFHFLGLVGPLNRTDAGYFSFVTQTTLGYGDITPRSASARGVAVVQSTLGVLYIAILVARLATSSSGRREE